MGLINPQTNTDGRTENNSRGWNLFFSVKRKPKAKVPTKVPAISFTVTPEEWAAAKRLAKKLYPGRFAVAALHKTARFLFYGALMNKGTCISELFAVARYCDAEGIPEENIDQVMADRVRSSQKGEL